RLWDRLAIWFRWAWLPLALAALVWNIRYLKRLSGASRLFAVLTSLAWALTPLLPAVMEGRYRKPVEGLLIINLLLLLKLQKANGESARSGARGLRMTYSLPISEKEECLTIS